MKELMVISLKLNHEWKKIHFGIPDRAEELEEMYKFRYSNYLKHDYIEENAGHRDIDEYDNGRSTYFIARIDNRIIGTVRMIKDEFLPTEKDCFEFKEPAALKDISRNNRAELGRLIIEKYKENVFFPRHLILLGLINCIATYVKHKDFGGGYAFIKNSLKVKLDKLKFPFHTIKPFKQIYSQGVLKNYFSNQQDRVYPIYYLSDEVAMYLNGFFKNKLFFNEASKNNLIFKNKLLFNIFIKFNAL
jgi:N-acyl-L-homoserine lactone synthetase